jgi:hypothetical protein
VHNTWENFISCSVQKGALMTGYLCKCFIQMFFFQVGLVVSVFVVQDGLLANCTWFPGLSCPGSNLIRPHMKKIEFHIPSKIQQT